ncbi:acyl CoA:acetate/3-ketoacid CoA transferase subunit alpha [Anaerobacillus alkalidiazotrophicus]|uniref:Acyl CoA:acetate/3-ketoacid CoA transferase subunit alpha n=2 Tax=Anaerobacillus alkalidiazotrophicus TaxID=472963 RepID=A0A1S2M3A1_9BACI|nr:CoA transferase subunit A [Anaerobacillus alkalidiazotrophicus]OIJ19242.1 acyl CoA:acetate/3-ketoacid CoA transferase subunit alpha [Anaerobacillus alkalidiazotrophicus]
MKLMKVFTLDEALTNIKDGMTIMYGGFGGVGNPPTLINGILTKGSKELTLIGNDAGFPNIGIGKLISQGRAKRLIASHIGSNPVAGKLMSDGKLDVEFSPQGTLVERIRSGGMGIGGVLVDIGMNTSFSENKKVVEVDGRQYLIEAALTADISIVFAKKADTYGNLIYDKSARNTNPLIAMAGDLTIAEVEEIVPVGQLEPEEIITPGAFVDIVIQTEGVDWKWVWE